MTDKNEGMLLTPEQIEQAAKQGWLDKGFTESWMDTYRRFIYTHDIDGIIKAVAALFANYVLPPESEDKLIEEVTVKLGCPICEDGRPCTCDICTDRFWDKAKYILAIFEAYQQAKLPKTDEALNNKITDYIQTVAELWDKYSITGKAPKGMPTYSDVSVSVIATVTAYLKAQGKVFDNSEKVKALRASNQAGIEALKAWVNLCNDYRVVVEQGDFSNGNTGPGGYPDEGTVLASEFLGSLDKRYQILKVDAAMKGMEGK